MSGLGDKLRGELMRFWLMLDAAPTGTPTITITRGQGSALDTPISTVNMTQGDDNTEWYYDYTTEAAAQVGLYTVKYIAVVDTVTKRDRDWYDVTVNDADSLKTIVGKLNFTSDGQSVIARLDEKVSIKFDDYNPDIVEADYT